MFLKELSKFSRFANLDHMTITLYNPKTVFRGSVMRPTIWGAVICFKHPHIDTRMYTNIEARDHQELLNKLKETFEKDVTL